MKLNLKMLLCAGAVLVACGTRGDRIGVARSAIGPNWNGMIQGLPAARSHPAVCKLTETLMLFAAGYDSSNAATTTAYVYDLAADNWTTVGSLSTARGQAKGIESGTVTIGSTVTNKCLAVGGRTAPPGSGSELNLVDEFQLSALSPPAGSWTNKSNLNTARYTHTVNKFGSSTFLVAGGVNGGTVQNTAEVYDPASGSGNSINLKETNGRAAHASMNHDDNTVLLSGGTTSIAAATNTAEVWLNSSGTVTQWTTQNTMTIARKSHGSEAISVTNPTETAIAIGGKDSNGNVLTSAEMYDSSTWTAANPGTWTSANIGALNTGRFNFRIAQTGTTNKLLIVSGIKSGNDTALNAETWDGTTQTPWNFTGGNNLVNSRYAQGHAVYLAGGGGTAAAVVIAGGLNVNGGVTTTLSAAEKY